MKVLQKPRPSLGRSAHCLALVGALLTSGLPRTVVAQQPPPPPQAQPEPAEPPEKAPGSGIGIGVPRVADVVRARRAYERGRALYLQRRYGEAIDVFLSAHALAPVPALLYNAALAAHKLNRLAAARDLLLRYLARPPRGEAQAGEVRGARELLEEIEGQLPGTLVIESTPPGARVFIDSEAVGSVGKTPFRGPLRRGSHLIIVDRDGFFTERRQLLLKPGETTRLALRLRASAGAISVSANVTGARVLVDGEPVGVTPLGQVKVNAGAHRIEVLQPGFAPWRGEAQVRTGASTQVEARLLSLRPYFWTAVGVGTAALVAGITLAALTQQTARELERGRGEFGGDNSALQTRGETLSQASIGLLVGGGVGLAVAAALLIWERRGGSARRPGPEGSVRVASPLRLEAQPWLSPGRYGAGALLRFSEMDGDHGPAREARVTIGRGWRPWAGPRPPGAVE